jgi:integrase
MASFYKVATGWRAQIKKAGIRMSEVRPTRAEARAWAAEQETLIEQRRVLSSGKRADFRAVLQRALDELPLSRPDQVRVRQMLRDPLADVMLADIGPEHFGAYRDRRLVKVSPATVIREFRTLGGICTRAVKEWRWMPVSPVKGVTLPKEPERRMRRPSVEEIARIEHAAGYVSNQPCKTNTSQVCAAFLVAIETGMRIGEILTLDRSRISGRVAHLPKTKNGSARDVPLSPRALAILEQMPPELWQSVGYYDALWRKITKRACVDNLHFHDSRHEAVTRLAKRLNVLELARMIGHKDIRELMTYYEDDAEDVAGRL